ncbi:MAG: hypothetical protein ACKPCP_11045, partial [Sphaerospermopsis kisseleviana]
ANKNTPQAVNVSSQSPQSPHTSATFNPSDYTASDLFKDSSSLPRTAKKDADQVIQSISEKRETLRLIGANLQLNTEAFKVGSLAEKMNQAGLNYQTEGINTQAKMIDFQKAGVSLQIAESKLGQTQEKLEHQNIELQGLKLETPLRQQYWKAKLSLIESRVQQVELAKFQLDAKIGAIESEAEVIE